MQRCGGSALCLSVRLQPEATSPSRARQRFAGEAVNPLGLERRLGACVRVWGFREMGLAWRGLGFEAQVMHPTVFLQGCGFVAFC